MPLSAAYAWWVSLSKSEKDRIRAKIHAAIESGVEDETDNSRCDQLLRDLRDVCREVTKRRGKAAGARCYASAMERYSACLAGKPISEWPPFDVWNN